MQVEVRPLPQNKWHGKKDGESFAQPKVIEALYDEQIGGYATGLTPEEAKKYGELLGVNLDNRYNPQEPHPTWTSKPFWVYLPNHTIILDDKKHMDFVKIKLLKASKQVANSMKDWEDNKFPEATHVIFDEAEETAIKATKIQQRNKAVESLSKLSLADKQNIVQILSEKSVKGQSADFVDVEIDDIIQNKTDAFLRYLGMGRAEITVRSQVLEMAQKNIITKEGGSYYYMGELIGMDYEDTVSFMKDPNNQQMKVLMLEKLEIK